MADAGTLDTTTPDQTAQIAPVDQQAAAPPDAPTDATSIGGPAPSATQATNAGDDQAPTASIDPSIDPNLHRSIGRRVLDGVLSALGGTNTTTYHRDPDTGAMVVTQIPSGPGMQFKRIIAGAMEGLSAGAGVAPGPGHTQRALAAGVGGGIQAGKQETAQAQASANQDYDTQQKALLAKAQRTQLAVSTANQQFQGTRMKIEATQHDQQYTDQTVKALKDEGATEVGDYSNMDQAMAAVQKDPTLTKAMVGRIHMVPTVSADGVHSGVKAMLLPDNPDDHPLENDAPLQTYQQGTNGEPGKYVTNTVPAGSMSKGKYSALVMAAETQKRDMEFAERKQNDQDMTARAQLEEADNQMPIAQMHDAGEDRRAAQSRSDARAGGDTPSTDETAEQLLSNRQAVSQITMRGNLRQNAVNRADQLSMERTGQHFSPEGNEIGYKQRTAVEKEYGPSGDAGKSIASYDSLLGHALTASNMVNDARQTNVPWLNTPLNKIKIGSGSETSAQLVAYKASLVPVRDEIQNLLLNNHAAHEPDKQAMMQVLSDDATPAQQQAALRQIAGHTGTTRLAALNFGYKRITGENVANLISSTGEKALRHFGVDPNVVYGSQATQPVRQGSNMGAATQQTNTPAPGPQTHIFNATAWAANPANKGKDVNAAIAQAKQQGYQVRQ